MRLIHIGFALLGAFVIAGAGTIGVLVVKTEQNYRKLDRLYEHQFAGEQVRSMGLTPTDIRWEKRGALKCALYTGYAAAEPARRGTATVCLDRFTPVQSMVSFETNGDPSQDVLCRVRGLCE